MFSPTPGGKVFLIFLKLSIQFLSIYVVNLNVFQTTFIRESTVFTLDTLKKGRP